MKKRGLALLLALCLGVGLLSGCSYQEEEITVAADGSASVTQRKALSAGTAAALAVMMELAPDNGTPPELTPELLAAMELTPVVYDGVTWYAPADGVVTAPVESRFQLLQLVNESAFSGALDLVPNRDGSWSVRIRLGRGVSEEELRAELQQETAELGLEGDPLELLYSMTVRETIRLPGRLEQVSGARVSTDRGLMLDGNTLMLDGAALLRSRTDWPGMEIPDYIFTSGVYDPIRSTFVDLADGWDWAVCYIQEMAEAGLFRGTRELGGGLAEFSPAAPMERAAFVSVLMNALRPDRMAALEKSGPFWWSPIYDLALEEGLLLPDELDGGDLSRPMTRQEMTLVLTRAARLLGLPMTQALPGEIPDYASVAPACRDSVLSCYGSGILVGVDEAGTFAPEGVLNRAQGAIVIYKLLTLPPA